MIVFGKEMLEKARIGKYAIPAANFFDSNSARVYVETAERLKKPLILAFAEKHLGMMSLEEAAEIGKYYAEKSSTPVVLHLDHGVTESRILKSMDLGFSSVMIDASADSFEDNLRRSKFIAEEAHKRGIVVEAEIGHVGSNGNGEFKEEEESIYTDVDEAVNFAKESGVDSLAISIGTSHGTYKGTPKINFDRLHEIYCEIKVPLVLHGGSSSGDGNLGRCATEGIAKINIFTDFIVAARDAMYAQKYDDFFDMKKAADVAMAQTLEHYFKVFHTK
ncbi:class II fructose-bisphosphate aldolase [Pseudolactococcus yaeyamensis]